MISHQPTQPTNTTNTTQPYSEVPHIFDTVFADEHATLNSGWFVEALRTLRDNM